MLALLQYRSWAIAEGYFNQMAPRIIRAIASGHDLIKKMTIEDLAPRIDALIGFVDPSTDKVKITYDWMTGKEVFPTVKVGGKNIVLIPVIGAITKYGDACSYGAQDYIRWINMANADPNIHGIVLIMDTPGGSVDGTPEFGLTVKNSAKPVGVFGDQMVASAGLWVASQASVIVGNKNNPTEFGSIGTLMVMEDYTNLIEAGRLQKIEIIRAPQSTEKALVNPIEPMTDALRTEVLSNLKELTDQFIATVKAGRGDKLDVKMEGLFKGRMFSTTESKAGGLIDAVGNLQTAINKVAELARASTRDAKNNDQQSLASNIDANKNVTNQNVNSKQMKFPKLSALLGAAASFLFGTGTEANTGLTTEQQASLEASEKKLTEQEAEIATLKADVSTKDANITSLNAKVTELTTQVSTLTADKATLTATVATQKAELEKKPTGTATTVIPGKTEEGQAADQGATLKEKGKFRTSVDDEADKYINATNKTAK